MILLVPIIEAEQIDNQSSQHKTASCDLPSPENKVQPETMATTMTELSIGKLKINILFFII